MSRFIVYGLVPWLALWGAVSVQAQEGAAKAKEETSQPSPAERCRDLLKEYQKAEQEFMDVYREVKTNEERSKAIKEKMPDRNAYADKMFKIASLCWRMVYNSTPESEKFLREVLAKNPGHEAKGQACLALGQRLKMAADRAGSKEKGEAMTKEAEALLDRVTKEFANVKDFRGTLGDIRQG